MSRFIVRKALIALGALLLVAVGGSGAARAGSEDSAANEIVLELRVWQHVEDNDNVWLSARAEGGSWRTLGTEPLGLEHIEDAGRYRYGDVAIAGVTLRFWQSRGEPGRFFVRPCSGPCPERDVLRPVLWRPLGMLGLPLDDGHDRRGRFRYGDITIAVPVANAGLLADREYLLALKDALEGLHGPDLNWKAATTTTQWEGITVEGVPHRVTKLELSDRGLQGEIWGWLGNLTELRELRLDGNRLYGRIPSKLGQLSNLTHLYLAGNRVGGCLPPPLRALPNHDLVEIGGLPSDCLPSLITSFVTFVGGYTEEGSAGTYQAVSLVFDISRSWWWRVAETAPGPISDRLPGFSSDPMDEYIGLAFTPIAPAFGEFCLESWVFVDPATGKEWDRHAVDAFDEELIDQLVASMWIAEHPRGRNWPWR